MTAATYQVETCVNLASQQVFYKMFLTKFHRKSPVKKFRVSVYLKAPRLLI